MEGRAEGQREREREEERGGKAHPTSASLASLARSQVGRAAFPAMVIEQNIVATAAGTLSPRFLTP